MAHWTERLFRKQAETYAQFFENRFDDATEEVRRLLRLVGDERGVAPKRILDVPCGSGRHVLAFADEGCHAEGLDFSEEFVERARGRAADRGVADRVAFHVHDMRNLDEWDGTFDLVTNFWNSMGYYDRATDVRMLSEMNRLLADDGLVAIETGNKEYYVRNFEPSTVREDDGELSVERREFDPETGRFHTTLDRFSVTDAGYEHRETMEWNPRQYAPVELKEMCDEAGFDDVSSFGSLDGDPLSLDSETVVVLAG